MTSSVGVFHNSVFLAVMQSAAKAGEYHETLGMRLSPCEFGGAFVTFLGIG